MHGKKNVLFKLEQICFNLHNANLLIYVTQTLTVRKDCVWKHLPICAVSPQLLNIGVLCFHCQRKLPRLLNSLQPASTFLSTNSHAPHPCIAVCPCHCLSWDMKSQCWNLEVAFHRPAGAWDTAAPLPRIFPPRVESKLDPAAALNNRKSPFFHVDWLFTGFATFLFIAMTQPSFCRDYSHMWSTNLQRLCKWLFVYTKIKYYKIPAIWLALVLLLCSWQTFGYWKTNWDLERQTGYGKYNKFRATYISQKKKKLREWFIRVTSPRATVLFSFIFYI